MKLYLICGKAEVGKDSLGRLIKQEYEKINKKACILKITAPLYGYAKNYFGWDGKEEDKPRTLLQTLGIEVIKNKLNLKFFLVNRLSEDIKILDEFFDVGIITDGRLIEEIEELKKMYSDIKVIHLKRNNYSSKLNSKEKSHITETDLDKGYNFDYEIENNSEEDLLEFAKELVRKEVSSL